MTSYIVIHRSK